MVQDGSWGKPHTTTVKHSRSSKFELYRSTWVDLIGLSTFYKVVSARKCDLSSRKLIRGKLLEHNPSVSWGITIIVMMFI